MKPRNKISASTKALKASDSVDNLSYLEENILGTLATNQNIEDPNNPSSQVNNFFEINDSFIFEDVPENENTLETLLNNKNFEPEPRDFDKNNFDETETVSKTQNLTAESHKIYSSCRMYTRKSSVSTHISERFGKNVKDPNSEVHGCKESSDLSENECNASQTRVFHVRIPIPENSSPNTLSKTKESVKTALVHVIETITKPNDPAIIASSSCNDGTLSERNSFDTSADKLCTVDETVQASNMNLVQCSPVCQKLGLMQARVTLTDFLGNRQAFTERLKNKTDVSYINKIFNSAVDKSGENSYQNANNFNKMNDSNDCLLESINPVKKGKKKSKIIDNVGGKACFIRSDKPADEINNKICSTVINKFGEISNQTVENLNEISGIKNWPESKKCVYRRSRKNKEIEDTNLKEKFDLTSSDEFKLSKNDINNEISSEVINKNDKITRQNIKNLNEVNDLKNLTESKRPAKKHNRKKENNIDNLEENLSSVDSDETRIPKNEINCKINSAIVNKRDKTTNQHTDNLNEMNDNKSLTGSKRLVKKSNRKKVKDIDNLVKFSFINSDDLQLHMINMHSTIDSASVVKGDEFTNQNVDNFNKTNCVKNSPESNELMKQNNRKKRNVKVIESLEEKLGLLNNDHPQLPNNVINKINISSLRDNQLNNLQVIADDTSKQNSLVLSNNQDDENLPGTSKIMNGVQNSVIEIENVSQNSLAHTASSTKEMEASMRYGQGKKYDSNSNGKCNRLMSDKYGIFNGACDEKQNSETCKTPSSRMPLSIVEMFKRYTDETDTSSNPNGVSNAQGNLIQNMLANSSLPKNLKKSDKLLSLNSVNNTEKTNKKVSSPRKTDKPAIPINIRDSIDTDMLLSRNNKVSDEKNIALFPHICRDIEKTEIVSSELLSSSTSGTYNNINAECLKTTPSKKYRKRCKSLTKLTPESSTSEITSNPIDKSQFSYSSQRSAAINPILNDSNSDVANANDVDNKSEKKGSKTKSPSKRNYEDMTDTKVCQVQSSIADVDNKSEKKGSKIKSPSKKNSEDMTDTKVCQVQSSIADNSSALTFSENTLVNSVTPKRGRRKKDSSELSFKLLHTLTNNSKPLKKTNNKNSRNVTKVNRKTVRKLLSSKVQTRTSTNSDVDTKSAEIELTRRSSVLNKSYPPLKNTQYSCSLLKNEQKPSCKRRQRSHSVHSFKDLCSGSKVVSRKAIKGAQTENANISSIEKDFDSTMHITRRKRSASVESELLNSPQVFSKGDRSLKRRNTRSKSVEPLHVLNMPVSRQDKVSNRAAKRSYDNRNDSSLKSFNSMVKSTKRKRSVSVGSNHLHYSLENMSNQVAKSSLKKSNSLKSVDKESVKNRHLKHSSTLSVPFNTVNGPYKEDGSFSTDSDSLDTEISGENLSTETQFNEQNRYPYIPFPTQTINTQVLNPASNSFIYGNPMVQYPQLINQRVFPNMNQFITQSQNPYYGMQNNFGNCNVPTVNIVTPQSAVTYPIYQSIPTVQSSNFPYNTPSTSNFGFQSRLLDSNAPKAVTSDLNSNCSHLNFSRDALNKKDQRKGKKLYLFNDISATEETTAIKRRRPIIVENYDEKLKKIVEHDMKQACFHKLDDNRKMAFSGVFNVPDLTVRQLYSNPLVLNTLKDKICEMIPDYDGSPELDEDQYTFHESFFDSSMREVMKDYVDFHYLSIYKKPSLANNFISAAFRKFPFRDCLYLSQAIPPNNKTIDFQDLICYLNCAAFLAILDECKKRNLV